MRRERDPSRILRSNRTSKNRARRTQRASVTSPSAPRGFASISIRRRRLLPVSPSTEGGFPSGQRGQTVNLMATPSQVRILSPPPSFPPSHVSRRASPAHSFAPSRTRASRHRLAVAASDPGGRSSMVERQPSKLIAWVRFPSPAPPSPPPLDAPSPLDAPGRCGATERRREADTSFPSRREAIRSLPGCGGIGGCCCSSVVEHFLGKEEVMGSSPISSSTSSLS